MFVWLCVRVYVKDKGQHCLPSITLYLGFLGGSISLNLGLAELANWLASLTWVPLVSAPPV